MDEKQQRELFRNKLAERINKVPERVQNGSIQATREWMKRRDEAAKLLKKPGVSVSQLISAISSLE